MLPPDVLLCRGASFSLSLSLLSTDKDLFDCVTVIITDTGPACGRPGVLGLRLDRLRWLRFDCEAKMGGSGGGVCVFVLGGGGVVGGSQPHPARPHRSSITSAANEAPSLGGVKLLLGGFSSLA